MVCRPSHFSDSGLLCVPPSFHTFLLPLPPTSQACPYLRAGIGIPWITLGYQCYPNLWRSSPFHLSVSAFTENWEVWRGEQRNMDPHNHRTNILKDIYEELSCWKSRNLKTKDIPDLFELFVHIFKHRGSNVLIYTTCSRAETTQCPAGDSVIQISSHGMLPAGHRDEGSQSRKRKK